MDDTLAIERCARGEADAFRHLVTSYQGQAMAHALAILGDRQDAEDAVQEAFLAAYRSLDRFDPSRRFYPWLYVILRNGCYKLARRSRRPRSASIEGLSIVATAKDGAEDRAADLREALAGLSANDREILVLRHFDGLRYDELAERLSLPRGTVMSRLYHARRRLRAALEKDQEVPNGRPDL